MPTKDSDNGLKGLLSAQKRPKMVKIDFIAKFCLMVSCETKINCGNIEMNLLAALCTLTDGEGGGGG